MEMQRAAEQFRVHGISPTAAIMQPFDPVLFAFFAPFAVNPFVHGYALRNSDR
jgi:hypothetical protein